VWGLCCICNDAEGQSNGADPKALWRCNARPGGNEMLVDSCERTQATEVPLLTRVA